MPPDYLCKLFVDLVTRNIPYHGWIINLVKYRHLTVTHKDITKRIRNRRGCPQGGILSPFLWSLVVDDLHKFSAKEIPGYLQAFADDLVTLAEGSDTGVIWQRTHKTPKYSTLAH